MEGRIPQRWAVACAACERRPVLRIAALLVLTFSLVLLAAVLHPAAARALKYPDVGASQWARSSISWVTDQRVGGQRLLDDYDGAVFRPGRALSRAQLARVLVCVSGNTQRRFTARELADVPVEHPYYADIQRALSLKFLGTSGTSFRPDDPVRVWQAQRAMIRAVRLLYPSADWRMLGKLDPADWRPNPGWRTKAPKYFAFEVAARYLGLHYNHPSTGDRYERVPTDAMRRDQAAYAIDRILHLSSWKVAGLSVFNNVKLPQMSDRQRQIADFALRWTGYPHIYGGEYPTVDSPYGRQAHGGFDCSGFVWWVMKLHFGYPISSYERTAAQMAAGAQPRIARAKLLPGDLIFFGPNGARSSVGSIYHTGLYLGNGWFIHSSNGGVSLGSLDWAGWSWHSDFAWGRRVLTSSELCPSPSSTPSPAATTASAAAVSATSVERTEALRRFRVRRGAQAVLRYRVLVPTAAADARALVIIKIRREDGRGVKTLVLGDRPLNRTATVGFRCFLRAGTYRYYVYAQSLDSTEIDGVGESQFVVY